MRSLSAGELDSQTWREPDGQEVSLREKVTQGGGDIFAEAGKAGEGWGYNPGRTAYRPDLSRYPEKWHKVFEEQKPPWKIDNLTDVEALLKDPRQKGLFGHRQGMQWLREADMEDFFQTSAEGHFRVSTRAFSEYGGRSPAEALVTGLKKLGQEELLIEEEAAIQGLWHEVIHNQQRWGSSYDPEVPQGIVLETLTSWASRRTYGDLVEWLGVSRTALQHEGRMVGSWAVYQDWVGNFRNLLKQLGLTEEAELRPILKLLRTEPDAMALLEPLSNLLAARSGKGAARIRAALEKLKLKPEAFSAEL